MPEAVIAAAVRTPIGRAGKGSLMDVRPDDLLAFAIREAVGQVEGLDPAEIVDVMVGCGFPQEKQGMNLARRAALLAGLPKTRARDDRQPLLRLVAADDAHGVPRDQGGRGRCLRRRRRRVDLAGRRLPEGRRGAAPEALRRGRDRERLHPDGPDRGERRRALRRLARGHGPLRAALAGARGGGAGVRLLRARADAVHEGGRHGRLRRRRPAALVDAREAAGAPAGLQAGRQGHRRQLVPAERRRRGARDHVRGARGRARRQAAGAHHRRVGHRARPGDHGRRPDRRRARGARAAPA